ncbi:hypothetical protein G7Y89_g14207 [Cudoniella acicularis]|uniref:Malonyl-CoA:ACP transacylase (MAT) domain-containing protein n=1 Tax=Cudoniella acicularis TaxID=354080 RepID=A0A8H4R5K6_9HELO|nr:hypothetical protein G7Y89_g14207 [Cudoniella acicularis]
MPEVPPRLGLVFNGQGAQWFAMGRELSASYPVYKQTLEECDQIIRSFGSDWSLVEELGRNEETSRVNEVKFSLPLSCAVQLALVQLLRDFGVIPAAVTGHSSDEIAALSLRDAMAATYFRGLITAQHLATVTKRAPGGMLAVGLGALDPQPYVDAITASKVVIACENSPSSVTLAGDMEGIEELMAKFTAENIFAFWCSMLSDFIPFETMRTLGIFTIVRHGSFFSADMDEKLSDEFVIPPNMDNEAIATPEPSAMATKQRLIKVSIFVKRNSAITEEELHSHWSNHHAALASPFLKRMGCLKYTQYHTPTTSKATITAIGGSQNLALQYDACAEPLVANMGLFEKAYTDQEWLEMIKPDEDYLFDRSVIPFITAGCHLWMEDQMIARGWEAELSDVLEDWPRLDTEDICWRLRITRWYSKPKGLSFRPHWALALGPETSVLLRFGSQTFFRYPNYLPTWDPSQTFPPLEPFDYVERSLSADPTMKALLTEKTTMSNMTPSIGSEIRGIQLSQLSNIAKDQLALLLARRKLLVFTDQDFADLEIPQAVGWASYFGRPYIHLTSGCPEGHPEIHLVHRGAGDLGAKKFMSSRISSVGWHCDSSFEEQPPGVTMLYVLEHPETGGDTIFVDMVKAYGNLSAEFRKRLHGLRAVHSGKEQAGFSRGREGIVRRDPVESEHPVVRTHEGTGEKALFVNRSCG